MRRWLKLCSIIAIFLLPAGLIGQLICLPPGGCSCEDEKVSPNLTIVNQVRLTGFLSDATGAPIQFNGTTIQVRDSLKNNVLFSATLDQQGRFDLGKVPAGKYRLVAFRMEGKKASRLPLFDQPKPVACSSENECKLDIALVMHGTDLPYEFCPPK
jgi:hypothetical protein